MRFARVFVLAASAAALLFVSLPASSQDPAAARVAAIKQWLAQSKAQLKGYQWIETTVISHKGEEKSRKVQQCYYDVSGALQKVDMSSTPPPKKKFGIRGAIQEDVQKEMKDYMEKAVALVKTYVPPSAEKLDASKAAGKLSIDLLQGGSSVRLNFHDYNFPGDNLAIVLNTADNRLISMAVSTYIDDPKDTVTLDVQIGSLPDGTGYVSKTTLDAKAKEIGVVVTNDGYRKAS